MNVLSLYNKAFLDTSKKLSENMTELDGVVEGLGTREMPEEKKGISFADMVNTEIDKVNSAQVNADDLTNKFMVGEVDDLHSVMIATEEARISLELAVQVRNKCIEAYKEINNMQL